MSMEIYTRLDSAKWRLRNKESGSTKMRPWSLGSISSRFGRININRNCNFYCNSRAKNSYLDAMRIIARIDLVVAIEFEALVSRPGLGLDQDTTNLTHQKTKFTKSRITLLLFKSIWRNLKGFNDGPLASSASWWLQKGRIHASAQCGKIWVCPRMTRSHPPSWRERGKYAWLIITVQILLTLATTGLDPQPDPQETVKGAQSYVSKFIFLLHLKNHHSKDVNLKFQLKLERSCTMLCSIGYIWWPYAFLSNCPLVDPLLPLHDL